MDNEAVDVLATTVHQQLCDDFECSQEGISGVSQKYKSVLWLKLLAYILMAILKWYVKAGIVGYRKPAVYRVAFADRQWRLGAAVMTKCILFSLRHPIKPTKADRQNIVDAIRRVINNPENDNVVRRAMDGVS